MTGYMHTQKKLLMIAKLFVIFVDAFPLLYMSVSFSQCPHDLKGGNVFSIVRFRSLINPSA